MANTTTTGAADKGKGKAVEPVEDVSMAEESSSDEDIPEEAVCTKYTLYPKAVFAKAAPYLARRRYLLPTLLNDRYRHEYVSKSCHCDI